MSSGKYGRKASVSLKPAVKQAAPVVTVSPVEDIPEVSLEELFTAAPTPAKTYQELLAEQQRVIAALATARELIGSRGLAAHRQAVEEFTAAGKDTSTAYWNTDFETHRRGILEADEEYQQARLVQQENETSFKELRKAVEDAREVEKQRFQANAGAMRAPYIGKTMRLTGVFADITDPQNPFALDPTFAWERNKHKQLEQQKWNFATVTASGKVLKARTKVGLEALLQTVQTTEQLMGEVGLHSRFTHIYEQRGNTRTAGKCSFLVQGGFMAVITGEQKELLPPVIALSSDASEAERVYTAIHELAHLNGGDDHPPHGDTYCGRFGEYLGVYLAEPNAPYQEEIKERIAKDSYSPPQVKAWALDGTGVRIFDEDQQTVRVLSPAQKAHLDEKDSWSVLHYRLVD